LGKAKSTGRVDVVNLPDISQLRRIKVQEALKDSNHEWEL
jgi:hypothetical protein